MGIGERSGEALHRWLEQERDVLSGAVGAAPSIHNARPWELVLGERAVQLRQRRTEHLDEHDPHGRDRRMSCGSALTHLLLAVRHLGWAPMVRREPEPGTDQVLAEVSASHRARPTAAEQRGFAAIPRRRSYRGGFSDRPVPNSDLESVQAASGVDTGETRWVSSPAEVVQLARCLDYAARVIRDDGEYQRELARWTVDATEGAQHPSTGIPRSALGQRGLPAVGLVTGRTRLPDEFSLATRIEQENVLVLSSRGDEPADHLRIGEALAAAWLEATARELAVSVMTQPLRLSEVREALARRIGLTGKPHVLVRLGYPK